MRRLGGLCKTLLEEVQAHSGTERGREGLQWPPIISEEYSPRLELGDGPLHRSAERADLIVIFMLAHVQVAMLRLAYRGRDVIGSDESFVPEDSAGCFQDHFAV